MDAVPKLSVSARAARTSEQPISFLIETALANPKLINLAAGLVDAGTLPVEECAAITQRLFSDPARGREVLQYGTTAGAATLRQLACAHVATLENRPASSLNISPDDIVVTTGSQQALFLISDVLLNPGDIVIAAAPSYFVYASALASFAVRVLTVPMDEDGMDTDALENLLIRLDKSGELPKVKLVYCTSYYQNPTGLTLSQARRPRILELAKRFSRSQRLLILEDAAYRELRYDGPALASIKSYDEENRYTILAQTFSKPFAPGIKTGYAVLPPDLRDHVLNQKGNHDFGSSNLCQHIAIETLRDGSYGHHLELLKGAYRAKRDAMLEALDRHMPKDSGITWTHPHGGLYVWITLPDGFDTSRHGPMFGKCVQNGVMYVPGEYCFQPDDAGAVPQQHLRLSFGQVVLENIDPGIERLAGVVKSMLGTAASLGRAG